MGRWSLRGWLLVVSLLFAVLVVGGISLTTYVIVSDGMQKVARDLTWRDAQAAAQLVKETASASQVAAAAAGRTPDQRADLAAEEFVARIPDAFARTQSTGAEFALYDSGLRLVWASDPSAVHPEFSTRRQDAMAFNAPMRSLERGDNPIKGLFRSARLGVTTVHMPVPES